MHDDARIDAAGETPAEAPPPWPEAPSTAMPTAARFALSAAILPSLTAALTVGDRVRMALLSCSDGHLVFVGRDADGRVARSAKRHEHAWFLPSDDDADGLLDHVVVYAEVGFDEAARKALLALRRVWGHGGGDLAVALVGLGSPRELGGLRRDAAGSALAPQLGTARVWESLTPFVPPRHVKYRTTGTRDTPHDQLTRLLALHGFPPAVVEPLGPEELTAPRPPSPIDWERFQRIRAAGGGSRGSHAAFGFRLRFEQPVTGPIALGYGAHQGLGQFVAVE